MGRTKNRAFSTCNKFKMNYFLVLYLKSEFRNRCLFTHKFTPRFNMHYSLKLVHFMLRITDLYTHLIRPSVIYIQAFPIYSQNEYFNLDLTQSISIRLLWYSQGNLWNLSVLCLQLQVHTHLLSRSSVI